jgi:plastocyanin
MKLDVLEANIAKVALAGLVLVLLDAFITQSIAETNAPIRESMLTVKGHVGVSHADAIDEASEGPGEVVVWLVPAETRHKDRPAIEFPHHRIVQHNKTFVPRLLVIPAGSTVDFPNNDKWFHNAFSISRGRQFDLGLYEAGVVRSVRFDRAGVSYLFCSIHPEMMAIVVTVDSKYFGISDKVGRVAIDNVPPGQYFLHVWRENAMPQGLRATPRLVLVGADHHSLPAIYLPLSDPKPTNAKNWMQ